MTIINSVASMFGVSVPVFIAIAIITLIYVIYSIASGKGMNVNFGKFQFGINFDSKKNKTETDDKTEKTCKSCPKKDLYIERSKTIISTYSDEHNSLKKDLIHQQMNFAEEKLSELRILLCKQYSKCLSSKLSIGIVSVKEHSDYKFYRMLVYYILLLKIKDNIVKKALKENHFLDLSNVEFDQYIQRKTDLIIDNISESLDAYYSDTLIIQRDELSKINDNILTETKMIIKSLFDNARNVSETYTDKIATNKANMDKLLSEL